jgi:hypothetical protein
MGMWLAALSLCQGETVGTRRRVYICCRNVSASIERASPLGRAYFFLAGARAGLAAGTGALFLGGPPPPMRWVFSRQNGMWRSAARSLNLRLQCSHWMRLGSGADGAMGGSSFPSFNALDTSRLAFIAFRNMLLFCFQSFALDLIGCSVADADADAFLLGPPDLPAFAAIFSASVPSNRLAAMLKTLRWPVNTFSQTFWCFASDMALNRRLQLPHWTSSSWSFPYSSWTCRSKSRELSSLRSRCWASEIDVPTRWSD